LYHFSNFHAAISCCIYGREKNSNTDPEASRQLQASLAVLGGVFGLVSFFSALDWRWLLGAIVLLANWPYTMFMVNADQQASHGHVAGGRNGRNTPHARGVLSMPGEVLSASRQP
jgi:hypothetical protein